MPTVTLRPQPRFKRQIEHHWPRRHGRRAHTPIAFCIAWLCLNASAAPQFSDYAAARYEGCVRQVRIEGGKSREFRHSLIADAARPGWKAPW